MNVVTRDRLIAAAILAAVVGGVVLYEKHVSAGTPVTTLTKGGTYKLTWPVPAGDTPTSASGSFQTVLFHLGVWQNVAASVDGNNVVIQAVYNGPDGVAIGNMVPAGAVVAKVG